MRAGLAVAAVLMCVAPELRAAAVEDRVAGSIQRWSESIWRSFVTWVLDGYAAAPVLMASLGLLALIPPLAVAGFIAHRVFWSADRPQPEPMQTVEANARGLGWPQEAWINVESSGADGQSQRLRVPRELMSVGRADDNDLVLTDPTVHGHHALINRSQDARIMIRDLSGEVGNGVRINGARVVQAVLNDGDRIEIGRAVLVFEGRPL